MRAEAVYAVRMPVLPVRVAVLPCENAGAADSAGGACAEGVVEQDAPLRQRVNVGRLDDRVAVGSAETAPVVRDDKKDASMAQCSAPAFDVETRVAYHRRGENSMRTAAISMPMTFIFTRNAPHPKTRHSRASHVPVKTGRESRVQPTPSARQIVIPPRFPSVIPPRFPSVIPPRFPLGHSPALFLRHSRARTSPPRRRGRESRVQQTTPAFHETPAPQNPSFPRV